MSTDLSSQVKALERQLKDLEEDAKGALHAGFYVLAKQRQTRAKQARDELQALHARAEAEGVDLGAETRVTRRFDHHFSSGSYNKLINLLRAHEYEYRGGKRWVRTNGKQVPMGDFIRDVVCPYLGEPFDRYEAKSIRIYDYVSDLIRNDLGHVCVADKPHGPNEGRFHSGPKPVPQTSPV